MKFGIYCNNFSDQNIETIKLIISVLSRNKLDFTVFESLAKNLSEANPTSFKDKTSLLEQNVDVLITIGGDGTILSTVKLIYGTKIPIVGVNTGRLGYLTSISSDEFETYLKEIKDNKYQIEQRTLLEIETSENLSNYKRIALNEVAVLKMDSSSMITVKAHLDGKFLNTYWADGLIISTATGSTAYSLSCGGPILAPGSGNFIVTPIAPHNLNVRPLVIQDNSEITLSFDSRSNDLLLALDFDSRVITSDVTIKITKAKERIGLLRTDQYSYLETLRSKLNWGLDKRN